ncbi:VIT1/CCC1 family predicted Fe2+/Mn2+ transporter [Neorhizobium galegae]|uniref:DoxX family protein n=1 Tax=Neorhizobium galegae TaxID=399 RepID=UPI001AE157C3|nr:DoxX family protein [Neorhizobium galegae]MBP2563271.1 VIT1/CCC1 family predicted Fe2+/Mn2+ transporter [Neorhizobium galegae]MDQ0137541.1 VIT1/CCC1 family predicted Fe2+/Mn2+ transporter [Neorhizobium galegae]
MNKTTIVTWTGQILLAAFFGYAGWTKLTQTPEAMAAMGWNWTLEVPTWLITMIGSAESLGAIGLILPVALGILPWLTTVAAAGLALLQCAAIAFHVSRQEFSVLWLNVIVVAIIALVLAVRLRTRGPLFRRPA